MKLPTKEQFDTFLQRTKITDPDGTFSHTSMLLVVAIVRLALFPADAYSIGILTLALAHANAKRFQAHKQKEKTVADQEKLTRVEQQVQGLVSAQSMQNLRNR